MATRSRIAMETEDGTVVSIYCHWDGYVEHNGSILHEHYGDPEKVKELIGLGDISFLKPEVTPTGPHSFDDPQDGVTVAYGRDRRETGVDPMSHASVSDFFNGDIEEFGYLFTKEGEWLVKSAYSRTEKDPVSLTYVLSKTVNL
jgi:hypothetical protein